MKDYIIRKKNKDSFEYYNKQNKRLTKKEYEPYLTFYIPPGYDDVKINKKRGKVRAIGYDDRGRSQYIYNPSFTKQRGTLKFSELIEFGKNYKRIQSTIQRDLKNKKNEKLQQIAMVLIMIIDCNFRVGNETYTKTNQSYGVTTLRAKHIQISQGNVIVDFIGKKGVRNKCEVRHPLVKQKLKQKKKTLRKKDKIFTYTWDGKQCSVRSSDVNKYLKELGNYSTKYFRTWSANHTLIDFLVKNNSLRDAIEKTAEKLHHTPAICKKNYLDPKLIRYYESNPTRFIHRFQNKIDKEYSIFLKDNYKSN